MNTELKRKTRTFGIWTWLWVASVALATLGPKKIWEDNTTLTVIAIIVSVLVGLIKVYYNRNLFNAYDELMRKVHLEAAAFTIALAVIVGLSFEITYNLGLIELEPKIHRLIIFMSITYLISFKINILRYK